MTNSLHVTAVVLKRNVPEIFPYSLLCLFFPPSFLRQYGFWDRSSKKMNFKVPDLTSSKKNGDIDELNEKTFFEMFFKTV